MTESSPPSRLRRAGLVVALLVGFGLFVFVARKHEPLTDWLFFRYAVYIAAALAFTLACLSSGHALVRRVLGGRVLPLLEHVTLAFAAGVYLFFLGTLLAGLAHLFGTAFFFAFPALLFASGAAPTYRFARRAARHLAGAWRRSERPPALGLAAHVFGVLGVGLVYAGVLLPNNVAFDSRWYHLGIAEHYAALGGVERFPEGWLPGTSPHLASLLYTWAFVAPSKRIVDHIEIAAHVEFAIFLFSLLAIPALVRRLVSWRRVGGAYRYAWAARFLFPGVFLYDSSVCVGADHIAAVFAGPIYLALLRAYRRLDPRASVLLALALAGALLTKYTGALILVVPALFAVAGRTIALAAKVIANREGTFRGVFAGPLAAFVAGVVFTAPQWLKNVIWYRDPSYPVFAKFISPRPWTVDSALRFEATFRSQVWPAERSLSGVLQTLRNLVTFSFQPNDWEKFHGSTPVFGSLFTLSLLALPFLRGTRRIWGLIAACHVGIFVWYWISHQDRYLEAALPWMAAATAATFALLMREGRAVQLAACGLIGLQIVWGGDVPFMPGHPYLGVPVKAAVELLSRSADKPVPERPNYTDAFVGIGRALPPKAKVLLHEWHPHLGIGAPSVSDCAAHQCGISYATVPTPREVYDLLSSFGVTHLVYRNGTQPKESDTLSSELVFYNFVERYAGPATTADGWLIAPMPKEPPTGPAPDPVLLVTCGKGPPRGLYHLADLAIPAYDKHAPAPRPMRGGDEAGLVELAQAVAQDENCKTLPGGVESAFTRSGFRDPYLIWVRKK